MLRELFRWQAELNRRIGFDTAGLREQFDPQRAGRWLNDYIAAASNELEELRDCTYWKHWCTEARQGRRFELHDLQNARVEVIDLLFFWISMAQCVGLDADEVVELYRQKLAVNQARQDKNYSMSSKTEQDNRTIRLPGRGGQGP
ncbi:MAG: dUTP diphosphatase [Phycisphaerae bacterium]